MAPFIHRTSDVQTTDIGEGTRIRNDVWREFTNFSPDSVVMVLASERYNEAGYIRDYGDFLRSKGLQP